MNLVLFFLLTPVFHLSNGVTVSLTSPADGVALIANPPSSEMFNVSAILTLNEFGTLIQPNGDVVPKKHLGAFLDGRKRPVAVWLMMSDPAIPRSEIYKAVASLYLAADRTVPTVIYVRFR